MQKDLSTRFEVLESPLIFASKRNFSNLSKIKNLESIISDISLKLISDEKNPEIKHELDKLRNSFKGFDLLEDKDKKHIISSTLNTILKLKEEHISRSTSDNKSDISPKSLIDNNKKLNLKDPIRYIKGVGPRISDILAKKDITTVEDLIFYFPRKYEDRRNVQTISSVIPNTKCIIVGTILSSRVINSRKGKIYKATVTDGTASLDLIWFKANKSYIENTFKNGVKLVVSGDVTFSKYDRSLQIIHPKPQDLEIIEDGEEIENTTHFNRIVPVYPLTEGLKQ